MELWGNGSAEANKVSQRVQVLRGEYIDDDSQQMKCVNIDQDWVRSVVVKREDRGHAVGYW